MKHRIPLSVFAFGAVCAPLASGQQPLVFAERDTTVDFGISDFSAFSGTSYNYTNTVWVTGSGGQSGPVTWAFTPGAAVWYPMSGDGNYVSITGATYSGPTESATINLLQDSSLGQGNFTAGSMGYVNDVATLQTGTSMGFNALFFYGLGFGSLDDGNPWYYTVQANGTWGIGTGTGNVTFTMNNNWSYNGAAYAGGSSYFFFSDTNYQGDSPDINATFYGSAVPEPAPVAALGLGALGLLLRRRRRA